MKYSLQILFMLLIAAPITSAQQAALTPPEPFPVDKVLGPTGARLALGLYGGIISNDHTGKFTLSEDGILCCQFDGSSGFGPTVALRAEYFLNRKETRGFTVRLAWEDQSAEFESAVEQLLIFGQDNRPEQANFQNKLDASLSAISFSLLFMFKLIDLDLYVSAGPSLTYFASPSFDENEQILGPTGMTYLDGTTELSLPDIPVNDIESTYFAFIGGLDLRYPLSDKLSLGSEIFYRFPLTKITTNEDWKVSNLITTIGVSLSI